MLVENKESREEREDSKERGAVVTILGGGGPPRLRLERFNYFCSREKAQKSQEKVLF